MKDLLYLPPVFIIGLVFIGFALYWLFKKDSKVPKVRLTICAILLYYYLCVLFDHIVGIPTLQEFNRLADLGESFFNPNMNLIPLVNGLDMGFVLNIFCFIPLGFLSPMISRTFENRNKMIILGLGLSLMIEISQLFTLYRATDINDLIANVLGTMLGYLCFKLLVKLGMSLKPSSSFEKDPSRFLPLLLILSAFLITFIN